MIVTIDLNDAQETRVLNVQENDRTKTDETIAYIFELGLKARENSIRATNQRKVADAKAQQLDNFNKFVAQGMKIEDALMYAGLAIASKESKKEAA